MRCSLKNTKEYNAYWKLDVNSMWVTVNLQKCIATGEKLQQGEKEHSKKPTLEWNIIEKFRIELNLFAWCKCIMQ